VSCSHRLYARIIRFYLLLCGFLVVLAAGVALVFQTGSEAVKTVVVSAVLFVALGMSSAWGVTKAVAAAGEQ